jgi:hypothetical protein
MFIAIAILFIVGSLALQLLVSGPRQFRKRAKLLTEYTAKRGYRLANPSIAQITNSSSVRDILTNPSLKSYVKGSEGIENIEGLERGTGGPFAFTCNLGSKEAMIFELSVSSQRSDDHGSSLQYKVAKIAHAGLPQFSSGKDSVVHTVLNVVEKMTGKPALSIEVDPRISPQFAKHCWLKGPDSGAVLAFLSPEKMSFLENANLAGTIATNSHYFVYFESGSLRTEQDYDTFIGTVDKLAANIP